MCYRADVPPLSFDGIAIACLSGENGAGKSALLDAITWALWGEARLRSDDDLIALGETEMMVDLTFSLDGQDYRVLRKRSKGKRGQSQLEFQIKAEEVWKILSGATVRETQQRIEQTLRMGFETFSNSAFIRQGRADEFTRKEPSKRKQVLADILGLDVYAQLEDASKGRAKDLDGRMKTVDGEIQAYRTQSERREVLIAVVFEAERRVEQGEAALVAAREAYEVADQQVRAIEAYRPLRDEIGRQIERLQAQQGDLQARVERNGRLVVQARQILHDADAIRAGAVDLAAAQAEVARLDGLRDTYDLLMGARREYEQAIQVERVQIEKEQTSVAAELRGLHECAARRPALEREIAEMTARLAARAPVAGELEQQRQARAALQERIRLANQLKLQRVEIQNQIEKRRDSLIASREELKRRIKLVSDQLRDEPRWRAELEEAQAERAALAAEQAQIAALRATEAQTTELVGALRASCDTIKLQGEQINEKIQLLDADLVSCPLCGSDLGHDGVLHIQEEFERERASLRQRFAQTKREADATTQELRLIQDQIAQAGQRAAGVAEVAARIARIERDMAAAGEARERQLDDQRQLDDVQVQIVRGDFEQGLRAELARVEAELAGTGGPEQIETEMKRADRRIAELEQQLSEQANLQAQIQSRRDQIRQIDDQDPALHELELRQAELRTTIEMGDYAHAPRMALRQKDAELAALGYQPEAHAATREMVRTLSRWAEQITRLERAEQWLEENEPLLARDEEDLRRAQAESAETTKQLQTIDQELRALDPAMRARNEAQVRLRDTQNTQRVAEKDLTEKHALLRQAEEAAERLLEREAERRRIAERKGLFDELTQAFGKKGVQALLIETAIPEIEREANILLTGMTDNQMHLRFETQGETKKGDVTETLDIKIADGLGTRDYDAYSGGESFRVDFAIRVALAKLLARRAGARLETLVIDEGFGSQDARGRERLVEAITSVQRDFKQILVVTHIQELKDMFPVQIEIVKTPEGSTWSIA